MTPLHNNLKKYWGYDAFRPLQEEAIAAVMDGRDSVVVLPTGGGKSLCYQAPATVREGLALVVSPLIALMKDQVDALGANGIPAACINSAMSEADRRRIWNDLNADVLKLLYVTPERLAQERFLSVLSGWNVSFVAIDEAHCISEWGHDFRPEYRQLGMLREALPNVSLHAFTATATPKVRKDIIAALGLRNPSVVVGSFDRPNLTFRVLRRQKLLDQVLGILDQYNGDSGIIYCIRRKDVDELCDDLNKHGHQALPYHAGLPDHERVRNQEAFIREEADIIVATVAFGMGIDKPNVRYVIHAAMPKSIENYQQESGRAGRDGLPSGCYLLHGGNDLRTWRFITRDLEENAAAIAEEKLKDMAAFCSSMSCRHKALARYFGEELPANKCGACDVCLDTVERSEDSDHIAQQILQGVRDLGERYGAAYTADVLNGAQTDRITERRDFKAKCYGVLKTHNKRDVRDWVEQLVDQEFIAKTGEYNVLNLTEKGQAFLRGTASTSPRLSAPGAPVKTKRSAPPKQGWAGVDRALFEKLRALRKDLAQERSVPPYVVFGDQSLRDMARKRPTTVEEFREVFGVGERKERDYAGPFLAVIERHMQEQGGTPREPENDLAKPKKSGRRDTADQAKRMFAEGASVEDAARATGRAESTVVGYLTEYLAENNIADPYPWLDQGAFERIRKARQHAGDARVRDIFKQLNEEVPYEAIQIAVACLRNEEE